MKYYNVILLKKRKRKKVLTRDKMGIENVEMWVIKWERVWNDDREEKKWTKTERERERVMDDICYNCEPRRANVAKENSWSQYFFWYCF